MKKYMTLINMLSEYNISRFDDYSIIGEYFMIDSYDDTINYISVFMTDDNQFNVIIETKDNDGEYKIIENKFYKSVNGVYNKIKKVLG